MSDARIAELFPNSDIAARVCAIRDLFQRRYESWLDAKSGALGIGELDKQRDAHEDDANSEEHCSRAR